MKQISSSRADCGIPPGNDDEIAEKRALVVVRRTCGIAVPYTCHCKEHEEFQRLIQGGRHVLHYTDTVLDYPDLFTITVRNDDDVQEFDTRWDKFKKKKLRQKIGRPVWRGEEPCADLQHHLE